MSVYRHKIFTCPYFIYDKKDCITCEAGTIRMPLKQLLDEYAEKYCQAEYGYYHCTLAKVLSLFYDNISPYE